MMKKYETPEIKMINFTADIIQTSGEGGSTFFSPKTTIDGINAVGYGSMDFSIFDE